MDKEEKPLVSIIIPAYNMAAYLADAIESALSQTWPNCEIIVVNDGSKDKTRDVALSYTDRGVLLVDQENKGLAGARNTGIKNAKGKYIALLDADDIFLPEKIEKQTNYLESHPDCGVCYCGIYHFYEDDPTKLFELPYNFSSKGEAERAILFKNFINPLSVVIRKKVTDSIGLFNESFRRTEDWEYWVRLMYGGASFEFMSEKLAKYRMRPKSSLSYNSQDEVFRKKLQLEIFENLYKKMQQEKKLSVLLCYALLFHKFKFILAKIENKSVVIKKLHKWILNNRLKSAS